MVAWGFPLNAAWEFAHSPLYADWNRAWSYLLWTRLHCTIGDVLILLGAFWVTALIVRTRSWPSVKPAAALYFILLGLGYTMWSEWYHTSIRSSWGYAPEMPVLAGIGLAPLLQWTVLPPLLLWLSSRRLVRGGRTLPGPTARRT